MGTLDVRVIPRASRNEIVGFDEEGTLRMRLTAPPVEGAANEALIRLLADTLDIPRRSINIVRGRSARRKTLEVAGLDESDLRRRLE